MTEVVVFSSYEEMAEEADKYVRELETWLADFSEGRNKRPDHQISNRRRRLAWVNKAREIFLRGSARDAAAEQERASA